MNLWIILLILGVVAMALGPVMMMQPNSAQRYLERLRSRAAELGLRVKIQSLPPQPTDTQAPEALPVYYLPQQPGQLVNDWLLVRAPYAHESHLQDYWVWQGPNRATGLELPWLRQVLPQLPDSIAAVGRAPMGICAFWSEAGGEKVLLQLHQVLKSYPGAEIAQ